MAFPLSSPPLTFSHKLSFTFSTTPNRAFLSTRFTFPLSRKQSARFGHLRVQCKSKHDDSTELEYWHSFPTKLCISTFGNGMKKAKNLIAAIFIFVQISSPLCMIGWELCSVSPAKAVLYSPDTKVPRTGELALRRSIPANTNMKAIQASLEDISFLLRIPQRKPYGTMEGNVKKALKMAMDEKDSIVASIPADLKEKGSELYASLIDGKGGLQALLKCIKDQDPDKVSVGLASCLDTVAELELLQAPGLSFLLPEPYLKYPRLTGRGTVEFTIEKGDGSTFSPQAGGETRKTATIQVVLDGYSAPLTAGNVAKLVIDGAYDGTKVSCTEQAILTDRGLDKNSGYSVPLEIKPSGQFEPLYKTTLSVQAGLGGLSFDEGQFSVLGYTTVGREILPQIKTGDVIQTAKLIEGKDRLVLPDES
ncbi:peptidyl-prolyl cis-trans isomerase CYP37, chloroplastic isoform X2 [Mangifera indica]|uniref:peptidyl-prolyl cis-trans isomerase CYP37, chloroplastic isoform X2 n=1 Tax=Mangifera indica TaxID=29780 RepID=UPI001CFA772E|nr:peptidyl-prolyl cis-trans isomerase CYP37, chloroplastic isoform X2 [Mangifera indica]